MRYVFFGTPRFAAIVLEKLIAGGESPIAIVCNPDKPVGRKKIITPPPTKQVILGAGSSNAEIRIYQPAKIDEEFLGQLRSLKADFFVVAAYAKILPDSLLSIPPLGVIGTHPSILPKFRGASPIQSVIIEGEEKTGVTLYLMDKEVDHGPVIVRSLEIAVDSKGYLELEEELAELAGDLLVHSLPRFARAEIIPEKQIESEATFTKKIKTEDSYIEPTDLSSAEGGKDPERAEKILRKILGMNPEPGTYTLREGKRIKLLGAKIVDSHLKLTTIQEEGKKPRFLA
jgi:methionyl-tRNA formyltransferase